MARHCKDQLEQEMIEKNYRIPSALEGYTVLLRNKYSAEDSQYQSRGSVLFVHGATYGSTSTFDYPCLLYTSDAADDP